MPDAKFESGHFSIFGNMTSQNFYLKNGTRHHQIHHLPWKIGLTLNR